MKDLLLCKPGEIFLKGLNKHYFEERLVANVKRRLKPIGHFRVTYLQSALYIEAADDAADLDAAYDAVRKVFGIATITRAAACEKDKDAITALAKTYLHDAMTAAHSFKVETKRSDKRFPMTSIELSQYVGGELAEAIGITQANLSILKTNKGKAIRFSTLDAICKKLNCTPGDILEYVEDNNGAE